MPARAAAEAAGRRQRGARRGDAAAPATGPAAIDDPGGYAPEELRRM